MVLFIKMHKSKMMHENAKKYLSGFEKKNNGYFEFDYISVCVFRDAEFEEIKIVPIHSFF